MKNLPANAGDIRDVGLIPGSGRPPGGRNGNPHECSYLGNPLDRGAWRAGYSPGGCKESDTTDYLRTQTCPTRNAEESSSN